jgi:hypothetical protein
VNSTSRAIVCGAILLLASACSSGRMAGELSRGTALALITEAEKAGKNVLPDPSVAVDFPADIGIWDANVAYQTQQTIERMRFIQHQDLDFYRRLAGVGLIKEMNPCVPPGGFHTVQTEGSQWYCFVPAATGVTFGAPSVWGWRNLRFAAAKRTGISVTGIVQQGPEARATVAVTISATSLYKASLPHTIAAHNQFESEAARFDAVDSDNAWSRWPKESAVNKQVTAYVDFTRYDDGWRVGH